MSAEEDLVEQYNAKDLTTFELTFKNLSNISILNMINQHVVSLMNEFSLALLKAILFGSLQDKNLHSVALEIYKKTLIILQEKDIDSKIFNDLFGVLNIEVSRLDSESLVDLSQLLIDNIKNETVKSKFCLDLFQKIIDVMQQHLTVCYNKQIFTGVEYRKFLIEEICSFKWKKSLQVSLIAMLSGITLNAAEVDVISRKILQEINETSLNELPSLVFQVLVFTSHCCKAQFLIKGFIHRINSLDRLENEQNHSNTDMPNELCEISGTILLYISNSLKQNLLLGKSLVKFFKNVKITLNEEMVSPFFFAVNMLLVQDGRFSDEVLSLLRSLILKSLQDSHKRNSSKSLQHRTENIINVKNLLFNVAKNCGRGWSQVIGGVVCLGFSLMSAFGPKRGPFGKFSDKESCKTNTPQSEACKIGINLISISFKSCKIVRNDIVKKLVHCIQSNLNNPARHYLKLLKTISKSYSHSLLLCSDQLKLMIDDLPYMHPNNAQKLFQVLIPVVKLNSDLRNSLILVLRKSLSSRIEASRMCALHGFVMLLTNFPVSEVSSLSQLSSQSSQSVFSSASLQETSSHSASGPAYNRMLCMEVIQAIKKCLLQQHNVRRQLYTGINEVATVNPHLIPTVIEILLDHLSIYYEDDEDILPPFNLKSCFSKQDGVLLEPLAFLLHTISLIMMEASTNYKEEELIDEDFEQRLNDIFTSFSLRLCKCEVDDFDLEKNNDGSVNNVHAIVMVLTLHQVLIEHWISTANNSGKALDLFLSYKKCYDHFCQNKPANFDKVLTESLSSASSLQKLSCALDVLLNDENNDLSNNENFVKHIMQVLHSLLVNVSEVGFFESEKSASKDLVFDCLSKVSRICYHKIMTEKNSPDSSSILYNCLECFHCAIKAATVFYPNKMLQFYLNVSGKNDSNQSQSNCLSQLIHQIQRVVISYVTLSNPLPSSEKKLLSELLLILQTFFTSAFSLSMFKECEQFADWCQKLCKEFEIDDFVSAKHAVNLLFCSSLHVSDHPELPFRDFSTDIHLSLDTSDDASELVPTYKIISSLNAPMFIPILTKHLGQVIANCDWLLSYIKSNNFPKSDISTSLTDNDSENRRKLEGSLCVHTCTVGVGLLDLLTSEIEISAAIEAIIVASTSYFNFLIQLCKYYLWLYNQSIGTLPSRFEKLVSFIGRDMMKPVYAFIMHAQSIQSSKLGKEGKTKKSASGQTAGRAKILRESKSISQLVYSIEQHEHHLILLARKSKIELMNDYHLPTSRDFRIRTDVIQMNINDEEAAKNKYDENEEEENLPEEDQSDSEIPSSKRRRHNT